MENEKLHAQNFQSYDSDQEEEKGGGDSREEEKYPDKQVVNGNYNSRRFGDDV